MRSCAINDYVYGGFQRNLMANTHINRLLPRLGNNFSTDNLSSIDDRHPPFLFETLGLTTQRTFRNTNRRPIHHQTEMGSKTEAIGVHYPMSVS